MKSILSAHQSSFLPWMGYWEKVFVSDVHVILDDVQFVKNNWINRVQLLRNDGVPWWFTVPVDKHSSKARINEITYNIFSFWENYHKFYGWYGEYEINFLRDFFNLAGKMSEANSNRDEFQFPSSSLHQLNYASFLEIKTQLENHYSSFMVKHREKHILDIVESSRCRVSTTKTQRLIDLCHKFSCDTYFSGAGAQAYLDVPAMEKEGIEVIWQNFKPLVYPHKYSSKFVPGLSCLDMMYLTKDSSYRDQFMASCANLRLSLLNYGTALTKKW